MFFLLSKIFAFLIQPLSWLCMLLIGSVVFKQKRRRLLQILCGVFLLFSNAFVFEEVQRWWSIAPTRDVDLPNHIPHAVVLGGFSNFDAELQRIQFHQASDRLWQTLRLSKQNCVEHIIISGGSGRIREPENKESVFIQQFLHDLEWPTPISIESQSRNTYENAKYVRELLPKHDTILLVTSELHMRRALECFRKQGFIPIPYTTDRHVGPRRWHVEHAFLPTFSTLTAWPALLHEMVGYFSYWWMDYL